MLSGLRRQLIIASETLYFLDDRPITELERKCVKAFEEGGKEAETAVRQQAEIEYRNKLRCGYDKNQRLEDESRIERKKQFRRMMNDVRQEKESLTTKLENINRQLETMDDDTGEYRRLWSQKYDLEREIKQDWFQKLKRDGE